MKLPLLASAAALGAIFTAIPALADDPNDPAMRSAAARERDRAIIRRLNQQELARVRARDAKYAEGWQAYREAPARRAEYERKMAEWRRAVRLCNSGHHEYCAR